MKINKDTRDEMRKVSIFSSILSTISFLIALLILISLCACNDASGDITPAQPIKQAIYHIEIIADNIETYDGQGYDYDPLPEEYNSNSSVYLYDKNKVDELIAESQKRVAESEKVVEEANKLVEYYHINFGF